VEGRFASYGWHVQKIDGHDRRAAEQAIQAAIDETGKPSLIIARTIIAKDAPTKRDTPGAHGEPLGAEEIRLMKEALGWPLTPDFHVPDGVYEHFRSRPEQVNAEYQSWCELQKRYRQEFPDLACELDAMLERKTPPDLLDRLLEVAESLDADATRNYGGKIMNAAAKLVPALAGGSADLEPSNKTLLSGPTSISRESFEGPNIHFGVREHGMGGIVNGMAYFGGFIPYGATFMVFSDYMRPCARLSALSHLQSIWIWTHDSIFVG